MIRLPSDLPPIHPGEILLEEFIRPLGMEIEAVADRIGIEEQRLREVINGRRGIDADLALRLSMLFSSSVELWLNGQTAWDVWHLRNGERASEFNQIEPVHEARSLMPYLQKNEKEAVRRFALLIRERFGENLVSMELFGSKVRGDFDAESDIDILLVLKKRDRAVSEQVAEITADLNLEFDCVLSPVIYPEYEFERCRNSNTLFYRNVSAEGVPL